MNGFIRTGEEETAIKNIIMFCLVVVFMLSYVERTAGHPFFFYRRLLFIYLFILPYHVNML